IIMILAPREMYKFRIRRGADQLGIPVSELAVAVVELGDLRRTYKRKVFGPPEHYSPQIAFFQVLSAKGRKLLSVFNRYDCFFGEIREGGAHRQNSISHNCIVLKLIEFVLLSVQRYGDIDS